MSPKARYYLSEPPPMVASYRDLVVVAVAALVTFACTARRERASDAAPPQRVIVRIDRESLSGCYTAEWHPPLAFPQYAAGGYPPLPREFKLTREAETGDERGVIENRRGDLTAYRYSRWEAVNDTEARLTWSTGFVGFTVVLALPADGGEVTGVATTFSDVPEPSETATVRLARIEC